MTAPYRGRSLWIWFGLYIGFVGLLGVLAMASAGASHRPRTFGWDLVAAAFSYGVILTSIAAILDGVRRIRTFDGEPDPPATSSSRVAADTTPVRVARAPV